MKSFTTLIKGATLVVDKCFSVAPGEKVLIIADHEHQDEARAVSGVAAARGAFPVIADITPHVVAGMASLKAPVEPPGHLAAAMENADHIIITTVLEWANRFAHVDPVKNSCARGARVASIEEGMGSWDLTAEDIDEIVARSDRVIAAMEGARWARVTTPAGTDVRVCIEGRKALRVVPRKGKGEMMGPVPLWGEVAYAAVEDQTEGRIVVDGIMLGVGVAGTLPEPIEWIVKEGRAVDIRGGEVAARLRDVVTRTGPPASVVAEFAIGTSEKERYGSPSEKGMLGTVHFALGDNWHAYPGGQNICPLHLDGSLRSVTVEVDGKLVVENGALKV